MLLSGPRSRVRPASCSFVSAGVLGLISASAGDLAGNISRSTVQTVGTPRVVVIRVP